MAGGQILSSNQTNLRTEKEITEQINNIISQQTKLLNGKKFKNLSYEKQMQHAHLNRQLMNVYWFGFEAAKEKGDYQSAADYFAKSLFMEHQKALDTSREERAHAILPHNNLKGHNKPEDNFLQGIIFWLGLGISPEAKTAVFYYQKAAVQGFAPAQNELAYAYLNGQGVEKNLEKFERWCRRAAEQGYASAQNNLGYAYKYGKGIEKNPVEAVRWYRVAADQGLAVAQNNLGYAYEKGECVEKNLAEAVRWYRLAAEQGYVSTQFNLGYAYEKGEGVEKNLAEAVRWYRLAAEQGHALAQNNLACAYWNGQGVEKNLAEAMRLYRLAAKQGCNLTQRNLKALKTDYANYILAMLEKDFSKAITLACCDSNALIDFLEQDFAVITGQPFLEKAMDDLLPKLEQFAANNNIRVSVIFTDTLLALNDKISKRGPVEEPPKVFVLG